MDQRAVGQHHFQRQHVRGGEAVLEAMRAAGVLGDVAADGADRLRRRVGRVEIAAGARRAGDVRIDDARLDDDARVGNVHFEDAVHARQADDDAALDRQRAAAQARARAARDKGKPVAVADAHDGLHLIRRAGQDHGGGTTRKLVSPSHS